VDNVSITFDIEMLRGGLALRCERAPRTLALAGELGGDFRGCCGSRAQRESEAPPCRSLPRGEAKGFDARASLAGQETDGPRSS